MDQPQGRRVQREELGEDSFHSGLVRDQPSVLQLQQPPLLDGPGPDTASLNSRMRERIQLAQANQNRLAFFSSHQIPQQPHVCCSGTTKHCRVWSHTSSRTLEQQNITRRSIRYALLDALVLSQKDSYVNVAVISLVLLGPDMQSFCF